MIICDKCGAEVTLKDLSDPMIQDKNLFIEAAIFEMTPWDEPSPTLCNSCTTTLYEKIRTVVIWELIPERMHADKEVADTLKQDTEEVTEAIREAKVFLERNNMKKESNPSPPADAIKPPPPPPCIIRDGCYMTKKGRIAAGKQGWRKRCAQFFMINKED